MGSLTPSRVGGKVGKEGVAVDLLQNTREEYAVDVNR